MRAPLSWLKEFVEIPKSLSADDIAQGLVRVGFEVEEIIEQGKDVQGSLVFAEVLSIEEITEFKKPIRYVGLDCGEKQTRFVICGATNFDVGDIVVVALWLYRVLCCLVISKLQHAKLMEKLPMA